MISLDDELQVRTPGCESEYRPRSNGNRVKCFLTVYDERMMLRIRNQPAIASKRDVDLTRLNLGVLLRGKSNIACVTTADGNLAHGHRKDGAGQ